MQAELEAELKFKDEYIARLQKELGRMQVDITLVLYRTCACAEPRCANSQLPIPSEAEARASSPLGSTDMPAWALKEE